MRVVVSYIFSVCLGVFSFVVIAADVEDKEAKYRRALTVSIDFASKLAREEIVIQGVEEQNAAFLSLEQIKDRDALWLSNPSVDNPLIFQHTRNGLATVLKNKIDNFGRYVSEIMITDNQGALVAAYPQTTDYWQGDEEQWINSFNSGDGRIHITDIAYDASTEKMTSKISVPILDSKTQTIGVLIVGIRQSYIKSKP